MMIYGVLGGECVLYLPTVFVIRKFNLVCVVLNQKGVAKCSACEGGNGP